MKSWNGKTVGAGSRRGASMIEFVLCIPLLALVIAVIFFFGWAMANQQSVKISGRYASWRQVRGGGLPAGQAVNDMFYQDRAAWVSVGRGTPETQTIDDMIVAAGAVSADAQVLARELAGDTFPKDAPAAVAANFPSGVRLWQRIQSGQGAIRTQHAREGLEWRRKQAACENAVTNNFLGQLDTGLLRLNSTPAGEFSQVFRFLYKQTW